MKDQTQTLLYKWDISGMFGFEIIFYMIEKNLQKMSYTLNWFQM